MPTKIRINNEKELLAVLTTIEVTMPKVKWYQGYKPTYFIPEREFPHQLCIGYFTDRPKELTLGLIEDSDQPASDFIASQLKSWCVKNDGSQEFQDTVVKWMREKHTANYFGVYTHYYYGLNILNDCVTYFSSDIFAHTLTLPQWKTIFWEWMEKQKSSFEKKVDECFKGTDPETYAKEVTQTYGDILEPSFQPKQGEIIEVSLEDFDWLEREFFAMDGEMFVCKTTCGSYFPWKYARPIQKKSPLQRLKEWYENHTQGRIKSTELEQIIKDLENENN